MAAQFKNLSVCKFTVQHSEKTNNGFCRVKEKKQKSHTPAKNATLQAELIAKHVYLVINT